MSDAPELLPCPFCGDAARYLTVDEFGDTAAYCLECDIWMVDPNGGDRCFIDWNRRAPRIATAEMVEKVAREITLGDPDRILYFTADDGSIEPWGPAWTRNIDAARAALRALGYEVRE